MEFGAAQTKYGATRANNESLQTQQSMKFGAGRVNNNLPRTLQPQKEGSNE